MTNPDQTNPQAVSNLGYQARRPVIGSIDMRADLTFADEVRSSLADKGIELPGTAVHDDLLRGL